MPLEHTITRSAVRAALPRITGWHGANPSPQVSEEIAKRLDAALVAARVSGDVHEILDVWREDEETYLAKLKFPKTNLIGLLVPGRARQHDEFPGSQNKILISVCDYPEAARSFSSGQWKSMDGKPVLSSQEHQEVIVSKKKGRPAKFLGKGLSVPPPVVRRKIPGGLTALSFGQPGPSISPDLLAKACSKCCVEKPLQQFYLDRGKRKSACKVCCNALVKSIAERKKALKLGRSVVQAIQVESRRQDDGEFARISPLSILPEVTHEELRPSEDLTDLFKETEMHPRYGRRFEDPHDFLDEETKGGPTLQEEVTVRRVIPVTMAGTELEHSQAERIRHVIQHQGPMCTPDVLYAAGIHPRDRRRGEDIIYDLVNRGLVRIDSTSLLVWVNNTATMDPVKGSPGVIDPVYTTTPEETNKAWAHVTSYLNNYQPIPMTPNVDVIGALRALFLREDAAVKDVQEAKEGLSAAEKVLEEIRGEISGLVGPRGALSSR